MFIEKHLGSNRSWINIDSDLISEQSHLYTEYDIDQETIEYALNRNERAHMDYNRLKAMPSTVILMKLSVSSLMMP